jgi:hypothetical protein
VNVGQYVTAGTPLVPLYAVDPIPENNWCLYAYGVDTTSNYSWVGIVHGGKAAVARSDTSTLGTIDVVAALTLGFVTNRYECDHAWAALWTDVGADWYGAELNMLKRLYQG